MKKMSRRTLARIITFVSAAAVALALFTGTAVYKAIQYERKSEAMYRQNLAAAGEYLNDINDSILKGIYSASAADQSSMCADVWMNAYEAKNAISALPISDIDMEKCYAFLSKTAEYARATEKQIAAGKTVDDNAHATFLNIKKKTAALAADFEKIQKIYLDTNEKIAGGIDFSFEIPKTIASASATSESLNTLNQNLSNAPKLIYDGPFSDAVNEKQPQMLLGLKEITLQKASEIAERFLKGENGVLKAAGTKKGNLPCFTFTKGNAYLEISVQGGKVVSFNTSDEPAKTNFSAEECEKIASRFLKNTGYESMKCDYYELANHVYVMNFHYMAGDVNCYTDLIKVKVNAETGKVCGFDATTYLTNHRERSYTFPLTAAKAQKAVSKYLRVKDVKKALIPNAAEKEVLCYEYRCVSPEKNELLVFIDAATGKQADLLILQITANGVLTK